MQRTDRNVAKCVLRWKSAMAKSRRSRKEGKKQGTASRSSDEADRGSQENVKRVRFGE